MAKGLTEEELTEEELNRVLALVVKETEEYLKANPSPKVF